jgi:phage terminase large subunit GpA-like protein
MALIKSTPWKYGLNVTYWMISDINLMKLEDITRVCVVGYINKQYRLDDIKDVIKTLSFDITGIGYTTEQLYQKIKESTYDEDGVEIFSFFYDAVDDI